MLRKPDLSRFVSHSESEARNHRLSVEAPGDVGNYKAFMRLMKSQLN